MKRTETVTMEYDDNNRIVKRITVTEDDNCVSPGLNVPYSAIGGGERIGPVSNEEMI